MSRSKDIGTAGERAVVTYLRGHGFPHAERRALAGAEDLGDIVGTPGLVWEVKAGHAAEQASDGLISDWIAETDAERANARTDLGVLVTKRAGYGPGRAASWWVHLDVITLHVLLGGGMRVIGPETYAPVRLHLSTAVHLLRAAGYGDPTEEVTAR